MIQDDIINELQYIPESKLIELYELIHNFRLRFTDQFSQKEFKIDSKSKTQPQEINRDNHLAFEQAMNYTLEKTKNCISVCHEQVIDRAADSYIA